MRVLIAFTAALAVAALVVDQVDEADTNRADPSVRATPAAPVSAPSTTSTTTTTTVPPTTAAPAPPPPAPVGSGALCIGDSVMLGASAYGVLTMCGTVDATVSRQASEGVGAVQGYGSYPNTVIIHLGTNGTVSASDVDAMLSALQGVPTVVLVNVQLNGLRSWEEQANGEIVSAADRWPNARLADWRGASSGHPEFFREDGFHPTLAGAQAYAAAITSAR